MRNEGIKCTKGTLGAMGNNAERVIYKNYMYNQHEHV